MAPRYQKLLAALPASPAAHSMFRCNACMHATRPVCSRDPLPPAVLRSAPSGALAHSGAQGPWFDQLETPGSLSRGCSVAPSIGSWWEGHGLLSAPLGLLVTLLLVYETPSPRRAV